MIGARSRDSVAPFYANKCRIKVAALALAALCSPAPDSSAWVWRGMAMEHLGGGWGIAGWRCENAG